MFVLGLILLVAAAVVGVVGVTANQSAGSMLTSNFTLFGWPVPMSAGWLFFWGIVTGLVGMLGIALMVRAARRARHRRREFRHTQREAQELREREAQRAKAEGAGSAAPSNVPEQREQAEHPTGLRERLSLRRTHK
ncbi:hypothetical protein ACWDWO_21305 [Actinopolymorpha singaporensis]|uniref:Lipopolysaccharide assembly protein A domain-containing protein n=1 Tax=Actinopolymorpha singaporensis TaxID=117157 RepID=A0A1H1P7K8_9ACTN|nr:hypothetical protein [Actinopolymorpha singaporensis]SDS07177.1 hypothetical protein SAMN04489717_1523 [Actinopolymorpha singaporensis]